MLLPEPGDLPSESERALYCPPGGRRPPADAGPAPGADPAAPARSRAGGGRAQGLALSAGPAARHMACTAVASGQRQSDRTCPRSCRRPPCAGFGGATWLAMLPGSWIRPTWRPRAHELVAAPGAWRRPRGRAALALDARPAGLPRLGTIGRGRVARCAGLRRGRPRAPPGRSRCASDEWSTDIARRIPPADAG